MDDNFKILDKGGEWIRSNGSFPFHHPVRKVLLQSGMTYKIDIDPWLQEQIDAKVFRAVADPMAEADEQAAQEHLHQQAAKEREELLAVEAQKANAEAAAAAAKVAQAVKDADLARAKAQAKK